MHGQDHNEDTLDELHQLLRERAPSLQPLAPETGIERYLTRRESEITAETVDEYRRKLDYFLEFCDQQGIDDLNALDGRLVDDYRVWRRDQASNTVDALGTKTMRDEMYLFRSFLRYLESVEAVRPGLADRVVVPDLGDRDGVRDVEIEPERVAAILTYLDTHRYADREHVVWLLHCRTGRRPGAIQSLDVPDVHLGEEPYLAFRHRPAQDTRLKKGTKSEGDIAIMDPVAEVLKDYIDHHRESVTDEYGREPLLTSAQGRLSKSVMRRYFYKWSRPCTYTNECPHGEVIETCPAAASMDAASKCPSSHASYATRHGHITQLRRLGVPKSVISDRCDVSEAIIDKHYDERTDEDRRQLQRDIFEKIHDQADNDRGYI